MLYTLGHRSIEHLADVELLGAGMGIQVLDDGHPGAGEEAADARGKRAARHHGRAQLVQGELGDREHGATHDAALPGAVLDELLVRWRFGIIREGLRLRWAGPRDTAVGLAAVATAPVGDV